MQPFRIGNATKSNQKVTSFSGCKMLKNTAIIRVKGNNRNGKFAEKCGKNNQMQPLNATIFQGCRIS